MKDFNAFLEQNRISPAALADILKQEYDSMDTQAEDISRIIAASMSSMSKVMDARILAYHLWLHSNDEE